MQDIGLILHIHGEVPGADPLTAEEEFLPQVTKLVGDFPKLKVVLEHVTTAAAVAEVKRLGDNVAATITAHHLELTTDDVMGSAGEVAYVHNYCKPVAKQDSDQEALWETIISGHPRFFLGSDSAPHPKVDKEAAGSCAGVFTSPLIVAYLCDSFYRMECMDKLENFCCKFGADFLDLETKKLKTGDPCLLIQEAPTKIPDFYDFGDNLRVVPFKAGQTLRYTVSTITYDETGNVGPYKDPNK
eukprot:GHVQ01023933.1.p1 GENE.GHVQ01023933.1~~GHVQ01023933.1.p1  ORF type:complete len:243 (-),score=31.11 GHVQ01023933.1:1503-2231(-)